MTHLDLTPSMSYPRLIKRIQAILIDSVLLPTIVIGTLILGNALGVKHVYGELALIFVPIFILEPLLVAVTGGTVGHHLMKIRITTIDGQRNINIFAATIRFLARLVLGWLSLIFVLTTKKRQAVHDLLVRSVVIHKDPSKLPAYEILTERISDSPEYLYPSVLRRVFVIIGYWVIATVAIYIFSTLVTSSKCILENHCTTWDYIFVLILNISWMVSIGGATVWGWQGKLYGCRRRLR